jgi:acetyl-CoA synthetase
MRTAAQVSLLYTAPTAIRSLQSFGPEWVKKYRRESLRVLGSVGEPINPEAWLWYHDVRPPSARARLHAWQALQ